ncbi:endogenous retrovirus group K, member 6 [Gossypium australe]|uniref:Endogenous retrovirus group K, member 6 n=1 Tax=Gossypium australe TaxID=47621 RepID=A0A5B6VAG4_9ROSI|nr:endogenous retrovirus group K, member 6 [Gossypium australe]
MIAQKSKMILPKATSRRGRQSENAENTNPSRGKNIEMNERFEARTPARAYAIRAPEEATSQDIIVGTFSLFDINLYALIDAGSTHALCPLKIRGYNFPASLMLLRFDDFDIILGMDWLSEHDAIVSCRRK